jgi:ribonuclease HIII
MTLDTITADVRTALEDAGFTLGPVKPIQYGVQFPVSKMAYLRTLRIYSGKKNRLSIDMSQLGDGPVADQVRAIVWAVQSSEEPSPDTSQISSRAPQVEESTYPLIGSDEAGKGDYFGPLVTAAVLVNNEESAAALRSLGVRDCKDLSDKRVMELSYKIQEITTYYVQAAPCWSYNQQYNQVKNLNVLLANFHARTIENLIDNATYLGISKEKKEPATFEEKQEFARKITLLVDKFSSNENTLIESMLKLGSCCTLVQKTHAESNIAVAAASILARAQFLMEMEKLSKEYSMPFPRGATDVIPAAQDFVRKYGHNRLQEVAKIHFKTTQVVLST